MRALVSIESRGLGVAVLKVRWRGEVMGPQTWELYRARSAGRCAQNGKAYGIGAMVYKPVGKPANKAQRILAECIDDADGSARSQEREEAVMDVKKAEASGLQPGGWAVTQGARTFLVTDLEFRRTSYDFGSFQALYPLDESAQGVKVFHLGGEWWKVQMKGLGAVQVDGNSPDPKDRVLASLARMLSRSCADHGTS